MEGSPGAQQQSPPESVAIKRRREEDDEDNELGKLMSGGSGVKRRNSSATSASNRMGDASLGERPNGAHNTDVTSSPTSGGGGAQMLRRKGSLKTKNQGNVSRFAFNKSVPIKTTEPEIATSKDESPAAPATDEVKDG